MGWTVLEWWCCVRMLFWRLTGMLFCVGVCAAVLSLSLNLSTFSMQSAQPAQPAQPHDLASEQEHNLVSLSAALVEDTRVFSTRGIIVRYWTCRGERWCVPSAVGAVYWLLRRAKRSIHLSMFALSHPDLAKALMEARHRGCVVSVVLGDESPEYLAEDLHDAGCQVHVTNMRRGCMHAKTLIVDEQHVASGSFNYSEAASFDNDESLYVTVNAPQLARRMMQFFILRQGSARCLRKVFCPSVQRRVLQFFAPTRAQVQTAAAAAACAVATPAQCGSRRVYSTLHPQQGEPTALDVVLSTIRGAQLSLYVSMYIFEHEGIADALVKARPRCKVEVVLDNEQYLTRPCTRSIVRRLQAAGCVVRWAQSTMHVKTLIADELHVLTGSLNYTPAAFEINDEELHVFYNAPDIAATEVTLFSRRWAEAQSRPHGRRS